MIKVRKRTVWDTVLGRPAVIYQYNTGKWYSSWKNVTDSMVKGSDHDWAYCPRPGSKNDLSCEQMAKILTEMLSWKYD